MTALQPLTLSEPASLLILSSVPGPVSDAALRNDWKDNETGKSGGVPDPLCDGLIVGGLCVKDVRNKRVRIAVV